MVMFVMSIYALCTAAITFSSRNQAQILTARILNCKPILRYNLLHIPSLTRSSADGYVGMELAVVPVFQAEIVPKQVRGLVVETYQLMLFVSNPLLSAQYLILCSSTMRLIFYKFGGLIMSLICYGTSTLDGNKQWQIPFALFFVIPTLVAAAIWFIPEVMKS